MFYLTTNSKQVNNKTLAWLTCSSGFSPASLLPLVNTSNFEAIHMAVLPHLPFTFPPSITGFLSPSLHWNFLDNSHQWLSDGQIVWAMSALHLGPPSYTEHFLALYSQDFHEFPPRGSVTPSSWHNFYVCASTPRSLLSWILLFELLPKFSFLCPVPLDSILSHTLRYFDLLFMLSLMYLPHLPPSPQVISPTCSCHSINTHTHSHTHAHAPPMPSVLYLHTLWFFNFSSFFQSQGSWRIQHLLFNHRSFLLQPKGGFVKQQMKLYVRRPHCMNPFQGLIHGFEFIIVCSFSYKEPPNCTAEGHP